MPREMNRSKFSVSHLDHPLLLVSCLIYKSITSLQGLSFGFCGFFLINPSAEILLTNKLQLI
jgi:hypothetical protein